MEDDDQERIDCDRVGAFGHYMCGVCDACDRPRFECGHLLINPTN